MFESKADTTEQKVFNSEIMKRFKPRDKDASTRRNLWQIISDKTHRDLKQDDCNSCVVVLFSFSDS